MKVIILIIFLMFLIVPVCFSDIDTDFSTSYVCTDLEGNPRWGAKAIIKHLKDDPDDIFILIEDGMGYYSGFEDEVSWASVLRFKSTKDIIRPIKAEKRVFNKARELLVIETQEFDYTDKKILCTRQDKVKNHETTREFNFSSDPINRLALSLYVQKLLSNGIMEKRVDLLTADPSLVSVDIKVINEEVIDIHNKELLTFKLCLDPNLGLLSIFKVFLPKAYTWHLAQGDFAWLKYKGPESNPTSIKVLIETKG